MSDNRRDVNDSRDLEFMTRALQLARRGLYSTDPNPRVGCVLVKDGAIVGEGWHERAGEPHAEIHALRQAGANAVGATAYVTLEPCSHFGRTPPCADALVEAGVARVVAATGDANPAVAGQGLARLAAAGIATTSGILAEAAEALNRGFLQRMREGRPWVRLKIAASLDGRTAMASGESQWITGAAARADVQRLRARSSAIVTGIGTVLADDPALTVRPAEMGDLGDALAPDRQPGRIVLDSRLRLPATARLLDAPGQVFVLCRSATLRHARDRVEALQHKGAVVVGLGDETEPRGGAAPEPDMLRWPEVMAWLGSQPYNEILIEAGARVAGSALASAVVDELWLYQAPTLLGSEGRPLAELSLQRMAQQLRLDVLDQRKVGEDLRLILKPR